MTYNELLDHTLKDLRVEIKNRREGLSTRFYQISMCSMAKFLAHYGQASNDYRAINHAP